MVAAGDKAVEPAGGGAPSEPADGPALDTYEPLDPDYMLDMVEKFFGPLTRHYFRPRFLGLRNLPADGPAILAANHSGSAFPYDAMVLDCELYRLQQPEPDRKCRSVFEKTLSATWWMRPFGIDNFWRRGGGVDMTFDNFDRLLQRGQRVLYYPEGVPGIGKGFQRRYQLQRFSSSFVIHAARNGAPVVPIYIINAEWIIPFAFMLRPLDALMNRLFKVPFMPLPWGVLAVTFPFLWYLALPARLIFVIGEPVDVAAMVREAGLTDLAEPDREAMRAIAERVRRGMQTRLDRHVERYGRWPYQWRLLRRHFREAKGRRMLFLPLAWVWKFVRHARDRQRPPARNAVHKLLRDWDLFFYYVPFGWFPLSLARRWRKPPCGYRGLSKAERHRREGAFTWHLKDRPLPPRSTARS